MFRRLFQRSLFIQTELTPNVNAIKFKPGKDILEKGITYEYLSKREAMTSPLASSLFRIDGISSVFYGQDFITITKDLDTNWQILKPDIYGTIMDFVSSGQPLLSESKTDTTIEEDDDEVVSMIKELLDTRIRPTIQDDGGDVEYVSFINGVVSLKLKGACRTCDSSTATLKNGVEKMLMHYVPEVEQVVQIEDEHEEISKAEFAKLEKSLASSSK